MREYKKNIRGSKQLQAKNQKQSEPEPLPVVAWVIVVQFCQSFRSRQPSCKQIPKFLPLNSEHINTSRYQIRKLNQNTLLAVTQVKAPNSRGHLYHSIQSQVATLNSEYINTSRCQIRQLNQNTLLSLAQVKPPNTRGHLYCSMQSQLPSYKEKSIHPDARYIRWITTPC